MNDLAIWTVSLKFGVTKSNFKNYAQKLRRNAIPSTRKLQN